MEVDTSLPFARSYQLEALAMAVKQNTISYLETGSGKTLIAVMLLRHYAFLLRKPSPFVAVFLVPQVVLVRQQAAVVQSHTDLKVGMYWGEMGVDFWDAAIWKQEIEIHEVLVMTPQILLNALRHGFLKLEFIKVLILDECHHASGNHPYACIMKEFYHPMLIANGCHAPRIFGMTASLIKSKCEVSELNYWKKIQELETMMHSKVYTCTSDSVISEYVPISTPKFVFYEDVDVPSYLSACLTTELNMLKTKHESSLDHSDLTESSLASTKKKLSRTHCSLLYCLNDLGLWSACKAAKFMSSFEYAGILWDKLDIFGERAVKNFSLEASMAFKKCIPDECTIGGDVTPNIDSAFLSAKVTCLIQSLLNYRHMKDIRCIIFVERVITSVVLQLLLNDLLPEHVSWKTKYISGNNTGIQSQTRKTQNEIVEEFRKGTVNIIVATSILEEGLDVQSCNLVIRFDPSATVSSFIQSRGRARMPNSEYLLMLGSGDMSTHSRLMKYLSSEQIMRSESLRHADTECPPLGSEFFDEDTYCVESTGAVVTSTSSITLIYFYCSRLPSDGYFKPAPRCVVDKEANSCTLYLPKSCQLPPVYVQGNIKSLKQKACLEACIKLHQIGALTDNLVPDTVAEKLVDRELGQEGCKDDNHPVYFPPDFVRDRQGHSQLGSISYYCYLIKLNLQFNSEIPVHDVVLVICNELDTDVISSNFSLETDRGIVAVKLSYIGNLDLEPIVVNMCRSFQMTILNVLINHSLDNLIGKFKELKQSDHLDYFLLPAVASAQKPTIDWTSVSSGLFKYNQAWEDHKKCKLHGNIRSVIESKDGPACKCMFENSLVCTPHNGKYYCVLGVSNELTTNSFLSIRDGESVTYKEYYRMRHGLRLQCDEQSLLSARHIFPVLNLLHRHKEQRKEKESRNAFVDLPPELCRIIISPISISTFYSFTFVPSVMHRLESLLIAFNLKKMHLDNMHNLAIPYEKILEAITTKACQEEIHLESLETLGDSFLKYAACQHLFKAYQNHHEGLLSIKKDRIVSNASLFLLGYDIKLPGFVRDTPFDPKTWMIPGSNAEDYSLSEEFLPNSKKIFVRGTRKMKRKRVADVVEALIGACLSSGGETATLLFMNSIGITVDFSSPPPERHFQLNPEKLINVNRLESVLNYSFKDRSLLVEALTHGSYMLPEIPRCYQRLEFLGDSVLDYLITVHIYKNHPNISPGMLTDMRSASVNNDCYARSAIKNEFHKHILHASARLHKDISQCIVDSKDGYSGPTFGWESDTSYPKVLGDVMESLAGAILVDSGYDKEVVYRSMIPLLEPLVTPETLRLEPVRVLTELCQKEHLVQSKPVVVREGGDKTSVKVQVEARNGAVFSHTSTASDKKAAKRLASKEILKALRDSGVLISSIIYS